MLTTIELWLGAFDHMIKHVNVEQSVLPNIAPARRQVLLLQTSYDAILGH